MATFGELKQQASDRLKDANNTAVSASTVGSSLNTAIKYWKSREFWFNQSSTTVTTTIDDPVISTGTLLFLQPSFGLRLTNSDMYRNLAFLSPDEYNNMFITGSGIPYAYTWMNGVYYLYFTPDGTYTILVSGLKDYADLVNDSDTNDFTTYADQLILYDALSRLTAELRTDPTVSDYYTKRSKDEAANLFSRTNDTVSTGRLSLDDGYYNNWY